MVPNCDVCKLLKQPFRILLKTQYWQLALGDNQAYLGRSYLTLLNHKPNLSSLNDEEWRDYINIVKQVEVAYAKALGATPFNWGCLMNNAFQGEPALPHVHWHIWPRHKQTKEINGETFTDKLYGYHYDDKLVKNVSLETLDIIEQKIKEQL